MKSLNLLGFDFGASSGRAMLGRLENGRLELQELHRFSNDPVMLCGRLVWDVQRLFFEMKEALTKASRAGIVIDGIGIDTWGVDFGLLDKNGALLSIPVHYRDARTDGMMERAFEIVSKEAIFEETGLAFLQFNTLYQLLAMKLANDPILEIADSLLMMPDLLAYFLTGEQASEYTIASTSQLIDPVTRDWAYDLMDRFGLPKHIFKPIQPAGAVRGALLPQIAEEVGMGRVPVIAVGSHDTASAVAAVPAAGDNRFAYISSGTWSLLGAEIDSPLRDLSVMRANYTNEGGICGTIRLLRNIMGLWIYQECIREWDRRTDKSSYDELEKMALEAPSFLAVIDVDDPRFLHPGNMPERIRAYCAEKGERVPESRGEIIRVIFESLALKYRWGLQRLERDLLNAPVDILHIVGGGGKNAMLNQFTAEAIRRPVTAGPSEATAIGNLLVQAMSLGGIDSLSELREVVANSFELNTYAPKGDPAAWDAAYARLLRLIG